MQSDATGGGDIEGIETSGHGDAHRPVGGRQGWRSEPRPFASDQQRNPLGSRPRGADLGERVSLRSRGERQNLKAHRASRLDGLVAGHAAGERHEERGPNGDTDGFAIERVAGRRIIEHAIGSEGGGVAKHPADVVVIGQSLEQDQPARPRPQLATELSCRRHRAPLSGGEDSTMNPEAHHLVEQLLAPNVDGDLWVNSEQQRRQLGEPRGSQEDRPNRKTTTVEQYPKHHLTFGDESLPPHRQIGFTQVPVVTESGVIEAGDLGDPLLDCCRAHRSGDGPPSRVRQGWPAAHRTGPRSTCFFFLNTRRAEGHQFHDCNNGNQR